MLWNESCSTLVFAQFKGDVLNLPNVDFAVYRLEKSMSQHNPTDIDLLHALTAKFDSIQQLFSQIATDIDRKSTRLNSSHPSRSRMPSSA